MKTRNDPSGKKKAPETALKRPHSEATPETLKKRRKDEILFLFERGFLEKHHLIAAKEIERVWSALNRSAQRITMIYEPREYDIPKKYHGKTPFDHMSDAEERLYRRFYRPWSQETERLVSQDVTLKRLVLDVVVENIGVSHLEKNYGLSRGNKVVSKHLRNGLDIYAKIAGFFPNKSSPFVLDHTT